MTLAHDPPTLLVQTVSVALSGVVASQWLGWLPPLAALLASMFAIAWYAIQIWESHTIQRWRRPAGHPAPPRHEEV